MSPSIDTMERFLGYWRIREMGIWDAHYLDLPVPAFSAFDRGRMGQFQFGAVIGWLDCRFEGRDRTAIVPHCR